MSFTPQNLFVEVFESDPNSTMSGDLLWFWRIFKKFSQSDFDGLEKESRGVENPDFPEKTNFDGD